MKTSSGRGMEFFNFKVEEEPSELIAGKIIGKLENSNFKDNTILKYEFSECDTLSEAQETSPQTKDVSVPCVDVDADDFDFTSADASLDAYGNKFEKNFLSTSECTYNAKQLKFTSHEECSKVKLDNQESITFFSEAESIFPEHGTSFTEKNQLNSDHLNPLYSNEPVDLTSEVEESMGRNSPSNSASRMVEDDVTLNSYAVDYSPGDLEMDGISTTVDLFPDYVMYRDIYCTGTQLTFSNSGFKISYSAATRCLEDFEFEWDIDDLINITCQWFQRTETIMLKLRVIARDKFQGEIVQCTSGFEDLKIAAVERNWPEKKKEIASLNQRYSAIWDLDLQNMGLGTDVDDLPGQRSYFPVFNASFEDVIFPKGDSDAVSISKRDVDLLLPDTFINDTIVDFYIQYLKSQILHEERHRFHFFNSFFFRKLADLDKDPSSASNGNAAFQRVHKWTRRVHLFEKEFIFIPVNFSLHWSLIVICHPGEVAKSRDEDLDKSFKVPCILHMDSIKGNHAGVKSLIQSYLWEEWKERQKETSDLVSSRFLNLRFVSLELPQQENSFDCGLFLLHYLELFLSEVPVNFNPFKITKASNFLNVDWFPPSEASLKRTLIQRLIFELLENHSRDIPSASSNDEDKPSKFMEIDESEGVELISARCDPCLGCQENLGSSQAGLGIGITLLSAPSTRNSVCDNESSLVVRNLFNPGASARSLLGYCQSIDEKSSFYHPNGAISALKEDVKASDKFMFLHSGDASGLDRMIGVVSQARQVPYSSKYISVENHDIGNSLRAKNHEINSANEPSMCASDDSSNVGIPKSYDVTECFSPKPDKENNELISLPVENLECSQKNLVCAPCGLLATSVTVNCSYYNDIKQSCY